MLTKCKNVLDPETGANKIFENSFMSGAYSEIFSGREHQFSSFFKRSFFRQINLSNLSSVTKPTLGEFDGMLPRKIFENLHTAMAILVLFELFLRKVCHISGP